MSLIDPLYRFVRPYMIDEEGYISYRVFKSNNKEKYKLSVVDGTSTTPEDALNQYKRIHNNARGVVCVTLEDCTALKLKVQDAPSKDNPFHCVIVLSKRRDLDSQGEDLYYKAKEHGWLYPELCDYKWQD